MSFDSEDWDTSPSRRALADVYYLAEKTSEPAPQGQARETEEFVQPEVLPLLESESLNWQERSLCAQTDPEAFFPEKGGSTRDAKRVCMACEVRVQCLEYALEHDERFGIWGGLSERERRRVKRQAM